MTLGTFHNSNFTALGKTDSEVIQSNITEGIYAWYSGVSSIVANDLTFVGNVPLEGVQNLTSVYFPNTTTTYSILITNASALEIVGFPSLLEATYISIHGNGTKYVFVLLTMSDGI